MTNYTSGSDWHKWDLHVHTPNSIVHNFKPNEEKDVWETYICDLEKLPMDFKVLGINDYLFIDGYKKVLEYKKQGRLKNIELILPVVEFRIKKFAGNKNLKRVNFHVIFSSEIEPETIQSQFLNGITEKYQLSPGNDQITWKGIVTKDSIADLGKEIKLTVPEDKVGDYGSDFEEGFNNLNVDEEVIIDLLNKPYFKNKALTAIGKTEWDSFSWDSGSIAEKKSIINKVDIIFTASESVFAFEKAKQKLTEQGVNNLLLDCSDAHSNSTSNDKDRIGNCNTWIKSELSFEGLLQIKFEANTRLHVGMEKPLKPLLRIDKATFDFPKDSKLESEIFCLSSIKEIRFSPYFTCIIGGRGAGKSTILNLIHEKISPSKNKFFSTHSIKDPSGKVLPISASVNIDNDEDEKYIEFLSQNEVEDFAKEHNKLTNAIYDRLLKNDSEGAIKKAELELEEILLKQKTLLNSTVQLNTLEIELAKKEKELATNRKVIESLTSDEYNKINLLIKDKSSQITAYNNEQKLYVKLIQELENLVNTFSLSNPLTGYGKEINTIIKAIEILISSASKVDFSQETIEMSKITSDINLAKLDLQNYLSKRGLTPDNQKDISHAISINSTIEQDIIKKKETINLLKLSIEQLGKSNGILESENYVTELNTQIKLISTRLEKIKNNSIKPITLHLEFDMNGAKDAVFNEFKILFSEDIGKGTHQGDGVLKNILMSYEPNKLTDKNSFIDQIGKYITTSSAKKLLIDILNIDFNFNLYKSIVNRNLLDFRSHKIIKVKYDHRAIENSSFGQRCTAVLVILLLLGNNPIIIDEPEAHLDSLLISEYLVDVIKERKASRQIIFATHNANFVINGDAELIHVLEMDSQTKTTRIVSTTIENPKTRGVLIGLEGGKEAFKKRESRYQA